MKFDGYRILARLERSRVRLLSRRGLDWTARLPEVAAAVAALPARTALLDGEAAVLLPDGTTSFQAMQNRLSGGAGGRLVYYLFDALHLDGYDLTPAPLESRKEALRTLLRDAPGDGVVLYSDHVVGGGPAFHAQACRLSLEGVVSKRRDAPYTPGRGRDWVKVKCVREQEVVIGGFTPPEGARVGLGALLVGVHDSTGALRYAGKVGTGFAGRTLRELVTRLEPLEQKASPFADRVAGALRARFVRPELVAQVRFTEWTADGRLRHPSFQGLREDKPARDVVREREEPAPSAKGDPAARAAGRETAAGPPRPPCPPPRGGPRAARSREGRAAIVPRSRASRQSRSRAFG